MCGEYIIGNCCMFPLLITQNKENTLANYNWLPQLIAPTYTAYTAYIKGQGSYLSSVGSSYLLRLFFPYFETCYSTEKQKTLGTAGETSFYIILETLFLSFCGCLL